MFETLKINRLNNLEENRLVPKKQNPKCKEQWNKQSAII